MIVFGTGNWANKLIYYEDELEIQFFIDNDEEKRKTLFWGYEVKAPETILCEAYDCIVLASVEYKSEMKNQLLELGVNEEKIVDIESLDCFEKSCKAKAYKENVDPLLNLKIRTRQDYELLHFDPFLIEMEEILSDMVIKSKRKRIFYPGKCQLCKRDVNLLIDNQYSGSDKEVNFRERLVCPFCELNNRQREMARIVLDEVPMESNIYLTEQITPMSRYLKKYYKNLICSEYLGPDILGGTITEKGIRHEDLMSLSFNNETFDCVLSNDVFEHVAEVEKAISEIYRVLKNNGTLYATFPFYFDKELTTKRAAVIDGGIINYILNPVYHGNPVNDGGSLVFSDFGFDFFELTKKSGFSDAYFIPFYSVPYGNIGANTLFVFIAKK